MSQAWWETAGDISINAFYVACLIFTVLYAALAPWYRSQMGQNIMTLMATLAAVGVYGIYVNYLSRKANPEAYAAAVEAAKKLHYPIGFWQIRFILFVLLAIAVYWRIWLFVKSQILARRARKIEEKKEEADHDLRS